MLIKSALITQQSGSVGGFTGSHNAGGLYIRARAIPVNPNTTQQQQSRSSLTAAVGLWGGLSDLQRQGWATYAANVPLVGPLGDARLVSGFAQFVRSNQPRLRALQVLIPPTIAVVEDAPTIFDVGGFTPVSIVATDGLSSLDVTFDVTDPWADEDGSLMLVQLALPQSPTINYFSGPFRSMLGAGIQGNLALPPTSPATIIGNVPYTTGQQAIARIRVSREDGRLSSAQVARFIVA